MMLVREAALLRIVPPRPELPEEYTAGKNGANTAIL